MSEKNERRGKFIVVDGLDGIGKGEIERAIIEYEQRLGKAVFDSVAWSKAHQTGLPELADFHNPPNINYHTIITAEPTYHGTGHDVRFEIIASNERPYSAESAIQGYSLDRLIQMKRVVQPALINGLTVIQSRSCASTLTYQSLMAEDEGQDPERIRERILEHEGNQFQLEWYPDLLIIPTIDGVERVIERIQERKENRKDDKAIFENLEFQGRLKPLYESDWLRDIFAATGTQVAYINAGISPESSRDQGVRIYKSFLETGEVPETYRNPQKALEEIN